jgi:magnesium transporter
VPSGGRDERFARESRITKLLSVVLLATLVGSVLPIAINRIGWDPAVVSAPLMTTLVDAAGLLIYLSLARAILGI